MIVSLLLGFFYLSERPILVVGLFTFNIAGFFAAYLAYGFPDLRSHEQLSTVGWISILSATIYMSWMAIYYANMIANAIRSRARGRTASRDCGPAAPSQGYGRRAPTGRSRFSLPR